MEINFMILWKKKVTEKKDLLEKVKSMLKTIFPNTESDELHYVDEDSIVHFLPYSISSASDAIVYLKIECDYSDAKSAEILSKVRDKLCAGQHRADFSIICTYDDASLSFCCRLMKPFGVFERRLREILYLTTVKAFGSDWVARTFPDEMVTKMKEKTHGLNDEKLTEKALELLDYNEINSYIFEKRRRIPNLDQTLDEELSDENLEKLAKEEIAQIIQKTRRESLWDKLFSDNEKLKPAVESVDTLRQYRNDTMHHHTMDIQTFKKAQGQLKKANSQLKQAVSEMERKIYTKDELDAVLSALSFYIPKIIKRMNDFASSISENIGRAVSTVIEKLTSSITEITASMTNMAIPQLDFKSETENMTSLADAVKPQFNTLALNPFEECIPQVRSLTYPAIELSKSCAEALEETNISTTEDTSESAQNNFLHEP